MKAGFSPGSASVALCIYKLLIVGDTPEGSEFDSLQKSENPPKKPHHYGFLNYGIGKNL